MKTGTCGAYGAIGDIAVIWPPKQKPVILVIYLAHNDPKATNREDLIAKIAKVVFHRMKK